MSAKLKEYLTNNGLLPRCQSAYRKQHSTETAMLRSGLTHSLLPINVKSLYWRCWICQQPSTVLTTAFCCCDSSCSVGWLVMFSIGSHRCSGQDTASHIRRQTVAYDLCAFRGSTGFCTGTTAFHVLHCRGQRNGRCTWSDVASVCRWLPDIHCHTSTSCVIPSNQTAGLSLPDECVDEFQSSVTKPNEDRSDVAWIETAARQTVRSASYGRVKSSHRQQPHAWPGRQHW